MKRWICALLMIVLLLSFVGCDKDKAPQKEVATQGEQTQQEASKEQAKEEQSSFALNETAVFEKMKVTATELKESTGNEIFKPEEEKVFVGVKFTIENLSDEELSVSSLLMFKAYVDDVKCDMSFTATSCFEEGTVDGGISSGKKLIGWYALEIPKEWNSLEVEVKENALSNNTATFVFENK